MVDPKQSAAYILDLTAKVAALTAEVRHMSQTLTAHNEKIDTIASVVERHRTIVGVFSALAAFGGALITHLIAKMGFLK